MGRLGQDGLLTSTKVNGSYHIGTGDVVHFKGVSMLFGVAQEAKVAEMVCCCSSNKEAFQNCRRARIVLTISAAQYSSMAGTCSEQGTTTQKAFAQRSASGSAMASAGNTLRECNV